MTTAVVPLTSDLKRKQWMREGLIQAASKSFWSPMTGTTSKSVVYQCNQASAADGHTVVFDYSGNLSGKAIKGKDTAYGKGETKRKFSDKITVDRYRLVVDNGDEFDAVDIGDLSISQHSDSRAKLGDLFVRFKDQAIFDSAQGLIDQTPTHTIDLGTAFTFGDLLDIERTLKTSNGFTSGGVRRPLDPYMLANGEPVWLFVIDAAMANLLRSDTSGYQTIVSGSDIRGEQNRNIKGLIGKLGSLLIMEAPQFFGYTEGSTYGFGFNDSQIEIAGLRQYSGADPLTAAWTGQASFSYASSNLHSRGLILGAGAMQMAFGKQPDYKFQASTDFGITSESAVEFWMNAKKTKMTAENTDYNEAKVAAIDYGVVAVDVEVQ
ncbi:major capsid protein [Caudoviricetes sp.]|nr:major capsid protein [Caudoviricetes sp.]